MPTVFSSKTLTIGFLISQLNNGAMWLASL
jgi:hypothetical protein